MLRPSARSAPFFSLVVSLFALAFAASPLACAGGKSAEDRQLDELREEITHVQADSDKFEARLDKLEVDSADLHNGAKMADSSPPPARTLSTPIATPQLRVVRLGPDGSEEAGSAGETAGAVEKPGADDGDKIRIQGSGDAVTVTDGSGNEKGGKSRRLQDAASPNGNTVFTNANIGPSIASHAGSRVSALDEDAKHAYDAALGLVNTKHYPEALDALAGFLVRWPDHPNADNAMFWRGECYFAQGDFSSAKQELEGLLARFPMGNKAPTRF